ncbi:MAG: cellobiose phosphorylase [Candidatus Omnitrophica bacterium]|nr:cellobiose phosphorylase [Candidatus Omnitrophota bacterium]
MEKKLWKFTDNIGSFDSFYADKIKSLYFPLANEFLMSSISSDLHGDIKKDQNSFLLSPVSRIDLINLKSSRNFWVFINKDKVWSATGVSKDLKQINSDKFCLEAGLLWQKITRSNKSIGLSSEVLSFVPLDSPVEIMQVTLTNISSKEIKFTPIPAIPMYARGANNIRDHRHVTSLLQRITLDKFGVISKPTLSFDEAGHKSNNFNYFVLGWDQDFKAPEYVYPTQEMFCGEGGDLEAPESILENLPPTKINIQGKEPMGAMRFRSISLKPGGSHSYIIVMGIVEDAAQIKNIKNNFNSLTKVKLALNITKEHWVSLSSRINLRSADPDFDNWFRWVSIQPTLRKLFGCSFLPDFDYGRGGRGWRDLWQDCLGLILNDPHAVRSLLINNFSGVRIDGSNATIIGKNPGEFIADRNNISRVWMDHGVWPLITLDLYINETGDFNILFEDATYFRNHEVSRAQEIDRTWASAYGKNLKDKSGRVYKGTILEHLLVQNLVQFYNVGKHNSVRLEGADWNDGLDMAPQNGESVAFSAMYAHNLKLLAELLLKTGKNKIKVAEEITILLNKINYNSVNEKHKMLKDYFAKTKLAVSGDKVELDVKDVVARLEEKSEWMMSNIRNKEWIKEGLFNGYYDNSSRRIDGKSNGLMRMTLTSQVFPIMSGVALDSQIEKILVSADKYLKDKKLNGYRLNTDFKSEQHNFGRAFSFSYGDKENGAFFNHMVVMFAYALYKQGFILEGWRVLNSIFKLSIDTPNSKIYPCLPEYFNLEGKGMYSYLTGSASWYVLTLLTQVFGIKGKDGDLLIEPKISPEQLRNNESISISRVFAGRNLQVKFIVASRNSNNMFKIIKASLNSLPIRQTSDYSILIDRKSILKLPQNKLHKIEVVLG